MYRNTLSRKGAVGIITRAVKLGARRTVEIVGPVHGKRKTLQVCLTLAAPWTREDGSECHALAFRGHIILMLSRWNRWSVKASSQHSGLPYHDGAFSAGYTLGQFEAHLAKEAARKSAVLSGD